MRSCADYDLDEHELALLRHRRSVYGIRGGCRVRRRQTRDPMADVPAELVAFDPARWSVPEWSAARSTWAERYGWPTGAVQRISEQRAARLAAWQYDDRGTVPPSQEGDHHELVR